MSDIRIEGDKEAAEGLSNLLEILESFGMTKKLSERSQTIGAVHHVFDDLEDHADSEEFEQAWAESLGGLRVDELNSAEAASKKLQLQRATAKVADKVMVAVVDARDLIDTGEFRKDVKTAPWEFE